MSGLWRSELGGCHPRLHLCQGLAALLPPMAGLRLRTRLYRLGGVAIGPGTILMGALRLTGAGPVARRLSIGAHCVLNERLTFNLDEAVTIEENVSIGMETLFITAGHEIGQGHFRAGTVQARPIRVGRGAWLGARVTVLPGVTIGPGAVVAAGAVVARDVLAHTLVGGVPAKPLRDLPA